MSNEIQFCSAAKMLPNIAALDALSRATLGLLVLSDYCPNNNDDFVRVPGYRDSRNIKVRNEKYSVEWSSAQLKAEIRSNNAANYQTKQVIHIQRGGNIDEVQTDHTGPFGESPIVSYGMQIIRSCDLLPTISSILPTPKKLTDELKKLEIRKQKEMSWDRGDLEVAFLLLLHKQYAMLPLAHRLLLSTQKDTASLVERWDRKIMYNNLNCVKWENPASGRRSHLLLSWNDIKQYKERITQLLTMETVPEHYVQLYNSYHKAPSELEF